MTIKELMDDISIFKHSTRTNFLIALFDLLDWALDVASLEEII